MMAAPDDSVGKASAPAALLLHGFGADRLAWSATTPALAAFDVSTPDLPGHGNSEEAVRDGSPGAMAAWLVKLITANYVAPVHLVGHSLGGGIALLVAQQRPDLVASLFLFAPLGLGRGVDAAFVEQYPQLATEAQTQALLRRLVVRSPLISKQLVQYALAQLSVGRRREALSAIAAQMLAAESTFVHAARALDAASIPRFVVWGTSDTINPLNRTSLAAFGAHMVLADTGHLPQVERAQEVNAALAEFYAMLCSVAPAGVGSR